MNIYSLVYIHSIRTKNIPSNKNNNINKNIIMTKNELETILFSIHRHNIVYYTHFTTILFHGVTNSNTIKLF